VFNKILVNILLQMG